MKILFATDGSAAALGFTVRDDPGDADQVIVERGL